MQNGIEIFLKMFPNFASPRPLPVLELIANEPNLKDDGQNCNKSFALNVDNLERILLNERIADKKVAVISVAGAYRMGKSFLLNFFLRYLRYFDDKGVSATFSDKWIKYEAKVTGFDWSCGTKPETTGILMWSEPFVIRNVEGEDIVVLLMDTQGAFDHNSSMRECSTIFALSTLISSVQIFNVMRNIQEDDLQHLQFFAEYGKLATGTDGKAPVFQSLLFAVRDWAFPDDYMYGMDSGAQFLDEVLRTDGRWSENRELRAQIRASFADLECCLIPPPGRRVASSKFFHGRLGDIDANFLKVLRELVPHVLHPQNITAKEINGKAVTCRELYEYVSTFENMSETTETFRPESIFTASAKLYNMSVMRNALCHYRTLIDKACASGDGGEPGAAVVNAAHSQCRAAAVETFKSASKIGSDKLSRPFLDQLLDEIEISFQPYKHKASMVDARNETAYHKALKFYNNVMLSASNSSMDSYQKRHAKSYTRAIELFHASKTGDSASWEPHLERLKSEIERTFAIRSTDKSRVHSQQYDAVTLAKRRYCQLMDQMLDADGTMELHCFNEVCFYCQGRALRIFDETPKAGTQSDSKRFRALLEKELVILGESYRYRKLKPKVEYRDKCTII